jgi:OOP family OmpA-OmpF porin
MKIQISTFIVLAALMACLSIKTIAQTDKNWEFGGFLGLSSYHGDVIPFQAFTFQENKLGYGLYAKTYLRDFLAFRLSYNQGELSAGDQTLDVRTERLASFSTDVRELALRLDLEAVGDDGAKDVGFVPYVFVGAGLTSFDPNTNYGLYTNADFAQAWVANDRAELERQSVFTVPVGGGLKLNVGNGWNVALELGYRFAFTDYLDGISQTGDPDDNDAYLFSGLTVGKRLSFIKDEDGDGVIDKEDQCPVIAGLSSLEGCPDGDLDGVSDKDDKCPDIPGIPALQGCPDSDGDGITDADDRCPGQAGEAQFGGCPDSDGDGIIDAEDKCPRQAGLRRFNGCADSDNDGIIDSEDNCPNEAGIPELGGCPDKDDDGDGVVDRLDECPDVAGLPQFNGCPDTDSDGVEDRKDRCPDSAGPASNNGCPVITQEDSVTLDLAVQNVNFASGRAALLPASYGVLDQIADLMNRYPDYSLKISGHTDSQGNDATNLRLSQQRAAACLDYLASKGIDAERMSSEGFGETQPIATNNTAAGRRQNRRVEFELYLE